MKRYLLAVLTTLFSVSMSYAQFSSDSKIHIYIPAGTDPHDRNFEVTLVSFDGNRIYVRNDNFHRYNNQHACTNAIKNRTLSQYIQKWKNNNITNHYYFYFDSRFSNSAKYSYRYKNESYPDDFQTTYVIDVDKHNMRRMSIDAYGNTRGFADGHAEYWVEVQIDDILPSSVNNDFLYE